MRIKITEYQKNELLRIQDILLLHRGKIKSFRNIKIEEGEENYGFRNKKTRKVFYVTECKLYEYDNYGSFLGTACDGDLEWYFEYANLEGLRISFLNLQAQLKSFGFEIKKIEKPTT
jgi:hypothetical protein